MCGIKRLLRIAAVGALAVMSVTAIGTNSVSAEDSILRDHKIGFVLNSKAMSVYQTPDSKAECPTGFNDGPREQFVKLFPEGRQQRTVVDTQLAYESEWWSPQKEGWEPQVFKSPAGNIAVGLNLDGKIGPNDFTSPDGTKGIDNQMYRVVGCIVGWRGPEGQSRHFVKSYQQKFEYNRTMFEITEVDSLVNDPDVTVTLYRGLEPLFSNAAGDFIAGGSQRIDYRWGKEFIHAVKGKIKDGVLTTDPKRVMMPESTARGVPKMDVHDWRLNLRLTETSAEGQMGGYIDIERFYNALGQNWGTHHRAYGQESLPSEYRALYRFADAVPNAEGVNTAISTSWDVKFSQVYIIHASQQVAADAGIVVVVSRHNKQKTSGIFD
jgi:hypothetical protein